MDLPVNTPPRQYEFLSRDTNRRLLKWSLIFLFWTALGVINASQIYIEMSRQGMDHSYWRILFSELIGCWYIYFLFTPVILWLGERFPIDRSSWKTSVPAHAVAFLFTSSIHSVTVNIAFILIQPYDAMTKPRPFSAMFWGRYFSEFHLELIFYLMILGAGYSFSYYRRYRERELRASQLESQLVTAQLEVLKTQLHPHFLFNTINGIVGLVRDHKNDSAVDMLVGLSDLLRYTLRNAQKQEVSLREELDFLELYLDLQQMRFSDRLKIRMNVSPETLEAQVPNMILQPLAENAIRHGTGKRIDMGLIEITTVISNGTVKIIIHDNGPGLPENWRMEDSEGIGLSNSRERLKQLYENNYGFEVKAAAGGGTDAVLSIPFKLSEQ